MHRDHPLIHPSPPAGTRRGGTRPAIRRLVLIGTAATALALLPALPAAAHDELVSETPAAGSTVTAAPTSVDLPFSGSLLELGGSRNGVQVVDGSGRHYETACATVSGADLTAPVALGAAGTYSVAWRAVSGDGHPVESTYTFTYAPAAGTAAASGSADGPSCGQGASAAASDEQAQPAAATGLPGGALASGAIGGAVLLAVVAGVLVVVLRAKRSTDVQGEADEEARR